MSEGHGEMTGVCSNGTLTALLLGTGVRAGTPLHRRLATTGGLPETMTPGHTAGTRGRREHITMFGKIEAADGETNEAIPRRMVELAATQGVIQAIGGLDHGMAVMFRMMLAWPGQDGLTTTKGASRETRAITSAPLATAELQRNSRSLLSQETTPMMWAAQLAVT